MGSIVLIMLLVVATVFYITDPMGLYGDSPNKQTQTAQQKEYEGMSPSPRYNPHDLGSAAPLELTMSLDSKSTLVGFAYEVGRVVDLDDGDVHVTGPHGFKAHLFRQFDVYPRRETIEAAITRVFKEFQQHLLYHATLDKMVKERMDADSAINYTPAASNGDPSNG